MDNDVPFYNALSKKVKPDVPDCGTGYHWDFYLNKCVVNCPPGYHNDSIKGFCVVDLNEVGGNRILSDDYYQFDLMGATIAAAVDSFGEWHNEYVAGVLTKMQQQSLNLSTDTIQDFLKSSAIAFFVVKGITPQNSAIPNLALSDSSWPDLNNFSMAAQTILSNLETQIDTYTESNHLTFITTCDSLQSEALNLSDINEAVEVYGMVSLAIHSFNYWKENISAWQNYLTSVGSYNSSFLLPNAQPACNVNLKHVAGADVKGGVTGVIDGAAGGPALAFASGVVSEGQLLFTIF